jgi:hypothetical protein
MIATAAFFAPLISISPCSGLPPRIRYFVKPAPSIQPKIGIKRPAQGALSNFCFSAPAMPGRTHWHYSTPMEKNQNKFARKENFYFPPPPALGSCT